MKLVALDGVFILQKKLGRGVFWAKGITASSK